MTAGDAGRRGPMRAQPQDVYNEFARASADQQLGIVLEFDRHLDPERLAAAVEGTIASQPVLGSRFARHGRWARFEPLPDAPRLALETIGSDEPWDAALTAAARVLDAHRGPLLVVTHMCGPAGDALAIRIDHTAADGQGAKATAYVLAAAYGGQDEQPAAGAPDRSSRRLMRAVPLGARNRALRERQTPRPTWGIPSAGGEAGERCFALRTLPPERFEALRAFGRAHSATVNDLVLAALYRALFGELDAEAGRPMAVNVSFDLRRYLDASDPMPAASNLSSVETALLARVPGESYADTLARTVAETGRLKEGMPGFGSAVLLEWLAFLGYERLRRTAVDPMERGKAHGVSFPFLSNFGVLDERGLAFGDAVPTRAVMLGPVGLPPFMMLGASSYRGGLTVETGFPAGAVDPAFPDRVLGSIERDLAEAGPS